MKAVVLVSKRLFILLSVVSAFFLFGYSAEPSSAQVYYGVHIDEGIGTVSGFAWNDGLGWIRFDLVNYDGVTGELSGTADILDLRERGLDGTLTMRGDCSPSCGGYGVVVAPDGTFSGNAWNDVIGWVDFGPAFGGVFHTSGATPSVSGYAWNDNIGWISMAAGIPPPEVQAACEASPFNTCGWAWSDQVGWFQHNSIDDPSVPVFGTHIDENAGTLEGHAWNDNLGYIDFGGGSYDDLTGEISGTASIIDLGINGTITLRGDCVPSCGGYGVNVAPDGTISGYAWNDVIGWIDFAPALGGVFHDNALNPSVSGWAWNNSYGWISFNFTAFDEEFGVNLDQSGNLVGYAWNDNVGWVDYDPAGPYPSAPNYSARWDSITEEVSGWAYVLGINSPYSGWLRMRDSSGAVPYGVSISSTSGDWTGWAWNDEFGWIRFDPTYGGVHTDLLSTGPSIPELLSPVECVDLYDEDPASPLTPTLDWTDYGALDGTTQDNYQVQVDDDPLFGSPLIDETVPSSNSDYTVGLGILNDYNVTYYWRVRVQSSSGEWTEWGDEGPTGESNCFRTPLHPAPQCDFSMTPEPPPLDEETQFTDQTVAYGGSSIIFWDWDFGDGNGATGTDPLTHRNPVHTYTTEETVSVSLTTRDSDGYECSVSNDFDVTEVSDLPIFRRVIPR